MNLFILERSPDLYGRLQMHHGWSMKRDHPGDDFVVIELNNQALMQWADAHHEADTGRAHRLPHPSTSAGRLKGKMKQRLGRHQKPGQGTLADLLEDMYVKI